MFFHQANETQGTDMSDPSEVNQPHPVLFVQGHGRYIQVPYYVPVHTPQIYPNFPVDPNHPHWFTGPPYGNPPIPNGRPSENDANETEQSVDDERPTATTFSPVVNLPPVSTMQPHPMYLQHFPNIYVPPYVNPPMYPGLPTNGEPNAPQNSNRRGGGGGKGGSGGKLGSEKQGGANDSYNASAPPLTPQDSNAGNDGSAAPTSMPMMGPGPQPNFMQLGTMQYPYPYFSATAPPHPPAHITSATHAAGSPIYIPHHPAVTMYHPSMYNSGPTAVFSSDNGMPHSAVAVPVSVAPPSGAHNEAAFGVKENANEEAYKNSTLMADSAPFEPENQKQNNVTFVPQQQQPQQPAQQQDNASSAAVNDVTMENSALSKDANEMGANDIGLVAENEKSPGADDKFQRVDVAGAHQTEGNAVDEEAKAAAKCDVDNVAASLNNLHVAAKEDGTATPVDGKDAYSVSDTNDSKSTATDTSSNTFETDKTTETTGSWNDNAKNTAAVESVNGKNSSSPDTSPSSAFDLSAAKSPSSSEAKSEVIEEPAPVQGSCKKSWASLFKESSSSTKSKPTTGTIRSVTGEQINSNVSTSSSQHVDNVSSKSSSGNSSLNGMPSIMSAQSKTQSYRLSSSSLADDTMLPKIGELLKNYKLDHRAVNIEPRGLENRSNYCYINAILQALLACPPFYNLMKSISHNLHHKTKLAAKQHFPIIDSMVQFVEEFKLVPQKARRDKTRKLDTGPQEIIPGKPFEPSYMYNMLAVIQNNSTFTMGQQEDAQEFLTCLLNGLNDEMVELIQLAEGTNNGLNNARKTPQQVAKPIANSKNNKKISNGDISTEVPGPDDCDSEWQQVQPKIKTHRPNLALTRTPLSEIFRGQMRSRLQKMGDQSTNTIEPFFTLHLNIEKANSVKEALELLVGRDAVEGVTSSRTNQEVDAWQQQTLEELPYVLLLHLKYFDYKHHTCTKIKKSIEFPIDLKLDTKLISTQSALRSKTVSNKSRQYKLFAVVYHDGNEATKGHYITDVFHIGYGGWVRYDDARVCTVSENDVLKPDLPRVPYLLYYRRCDTIAALMQPPFEKRM